MSDEYVSNVLYHFVGRTLASDEERYELLTALLCGDAGKTKDGRNILVGSFDNKDPDEANDKNENFLDTTIFGIEERATGKVTLCRRFRVEGGDLVLESVRGKGKPIRMKCSKVDISVPGICYSVGTPDLSFARDPTTGNVVKVLRDELIHVDAVCFCDIPRGKLNRHKKIYGGFGMGFRKSFVMRNHGYPVHYISYETDMGTPDSPQSLENVLKGIFVKGQRIHYDISLPKSKEASPKLAEKWKEFWRELQENVLSFIKPFRNAEDPDNDKNYYMEREWRIAGSLRYTLGDVVEVIVPQGCGYKERLEKDICGVNRDTICEL